MATTDKAASSVAKDDPEIGVQTAASDPNDLVKTNKSDRVKVADNATHLLDPHRGHGGCYVINDDGVRVRAGE